MGSTPSEDFNVAFNLLQRLKAETSIQGQGEIKSAFYAERIASILAEVRPSANVIAITGWLAIKHSRFQWEPDIVAALDDAFHLRLNEELIRNQDELADSNDRLGRKMLFVAWVGVVVAVVGALAALLPLFGK